MSEFSHGTVSLLSNGQILLYSFITNLLYTMMDCVHTRQLHFDPQIIKLNVRITRQNSTVCAMHEARPENLMATKKKMTVLNLILLFLQTRRNNLFFKKTVSSVRRNSIYPKSKETKNWIWMNLNYSIRKNAWPEKVAASVNRPWNCSANSPSHHNQHFLPWEKTKGP